MSETTKRVLWALIAALIVLLYVSEQHLYDAFMAKCQQDGTPTAKCRDEYIKEMR